MDSGENCGVVLYLMVFCQLSCSGILGHAWLCGGPGSVIGHCDDACGWLLAVVWLYLGILCDAIDFQAMLIFAS